MIRQPTAGMAPPTSLTQWNAEQQQSAGQVDVAALLTRVQGGLRTQGIMAWVRFGLTLEQAASESGSSIGRASLKRVLAEAGISISDVDARAIITYLCGSDEGRTAPDDVKNLICGPLTGQRLDLVQSVFDVLDKKKVGYISLADVLQAHDATKHPSVMFGDKSPAQVHQEFLESFAAATRQTGNLTGTAAFVSLYQWMTYFQYLSGHVPNDEYFELLLKRVWRASPRTLLNEFSSSHRNLSTTSDALTSMVAYPTAPMSLLEALQDNRIPVSDGIRPALTISTTMAPPPAPQITKALSRGPRPEDDVLSMRKAAHTTKEFLKGEQLAACMVDPTSPSSIPTKVKSPTSASAGLDAGSASVLKKLRASLKARGLGALVELTRAIRLSDENGDGRLSLMEFKSAVKSEPMLQQLSDVDLRCLFKHLDRANQGAVPISDVLDLIREPMSSRRKQLVLAAFQFLDKLRAGTLDPFEVVQSYDASRHPDVIAQRKTEEQLFQEFVDNFDVVDDTSGATEGRISSAQWEQYYHNVSFFVPDDDFFELMIRNTWQLPASALPVSSSGNGGTSLSPSLLSPHSAVNQSVTHTPRGAGMRSHQAFAILQPDLADQHQEQAAGGAGYGLLPPPNGVSVNAPISSSPACMVSANKQSKELRRVIHQLRAALKEQGAIGFISLQRKFRLMDSDRNGNISLPEFLTALKDTGVFLSTLDAKNLFHYFDANHDGSVDFSEFLAGIREPMSERRMLFVRMAFDLMDKDGNGVLEVADIIDVYDARKHPEVISGRKTEKEVFAEFLDTFEASGGGQRDGKVTFDEWTHYYANISAAIDDDDYFELMMRNAWHISGGTGWSANSSNRRVLVTDADGNSSVREVPNDLGVRREDVPRVMAAAMAAGGQVKAGAPIRTSFYEILDHTTKPSDLQERRVKKNNGSDAIAVCLGKDPSNAIASSANSISGAPAVPAAGMPTSRRASANTAPIGIFTKREPPAGVQAILSKMKTALKAKGAHGFCGLSRTFRLMDEDGNGSINLAEFRKAVAACEVAVADADVRLLFQYFDSNRNGSIDLNEFIGGVRDPMNERRVVFVREAFKRMDKDGNGLLEPSDIVEGFDSSQHPDVLSGRKTPEQVCREFLETFDVEGAYNGKVTWDQWLHYYHNISASIDDDDYFELMMRNAWHISGGVGWCGNTTNRRVLVTLKDGTDVVREVENDLGVKIGDVSARLLQQERSKKSNNNSSSSNNNNNEGSSSPMVQVAAFTSKVDLTEKRPPGKKILSLKDISNSTAMDIAPAFAASTSNCAGDVVLHMIRHRLVQKSVVDIVQLRKRLELSTDAKTTAITASSCREALNTTLGLALTEAHCIALFDHIRQILQRPEDDPRMPLRGFGTPAAASQRIAVRLLVQGLVGTLSGGCSAAAQRVFASMQASGKGRVIPAALAKSFRAADHPSVKLGLATTADVFQEFARAIEIPGDGIVGWEHFETYCTNLRASVGSDEMLLLLLRECF